MRIRYIGPILIAFIVIAALSCIELFGTKNPWPLYSSLLVKDEKSIEKIRSGSYDLDKKNKAGESILVNATRLGDLPLVTLLLEAGANPFALGDTGLSPLSEAVKHNKHEVAEYFLANDLFCDDELDEILLLATGNNSDAVIPRLLSLDHDFKEVLDEAICRLCAQVRIDLSLVLLLIEKGASPNASSSAFQSPLISATHYRNTDLIKMLIQKGADPNANTTLNNGNSALHEAVLWGDQAILEYLFQHGADIHNRNSLGMTPLAKAVSIRNIDAALFLLKKGADLYSKDNYNNTVLDELKHTRENFDNILLNETLVLNDRDFYCASFTPLFEEQNVQSRLIRWIKRGEAVRVLSYGEYNNSYWIELEMEGGEQGWAMEKTFSRIKGDTYELSEDDVNKYLRSWDSFSSKDTMIVFRYRNYELYSKKDASLDLIEEGSWHMYSADGFEIFTVELYPASENDIMPERKTMTISNIRAEGFTVDGIEYLASGFDSSDYFYK